MGVAYWAKLDGRKPRASGSPPAIVLTPLGGSVALMVADRYRPLVLLDGDGGGRARAAAGMALVIVPHEEADDGHRDQDGAEQEADQDVAAAAANYQLQLPWNSPVLSLTQRVPARRSVP